MKINKNWIKNAYFKVIKIYKYYQNSYIIRSGVTLGSKDLILEYFRKNEGKVA